MASKRRIFTDIYGNRKGDRPKQKTLDIFVSAMRPKLRSLNVEIKTIWGTGWMIDPENKQRIREAVEGLSPKTLNGKAGHGVSREIVARPTL